MLTGCLKQKTRTTLDSTVVPFRVAGMNLQSSIAWMAVVVKGGASRSVFVLCTLPASLMLASRMTVPGHTGYPSAVTGYVGNVARVTSEG